MTVTRETTIYVRPKITFAEYLAERMNGFIHRPKPKYDEEQNPYGPYIDVWIPFEKQPLFARFRRLDRKAYRICRITQPGSQGYNSNVCIDSLEDLELISQIATEYEADYSEYKKLKGVGYGNVEGELKINLSVTNVSKETRKKKA